MLRKKLLESIWDGSVTALPGDETGPVAAAVQQVVRAPVVCLRGPQSALRGLRVLPEVIELIPGVTLGDVLTEELGLDVPYGALVVFEDEAGDAAPDADTIRAMLERAMLDVLLPALPEPAQGDAAQAEATRIDPARPLPFQAFRDKGLNAHFFARPAPAQADTQRLEPRAAS